MKILSALLFTASLLSAERLPLVDITEKCIPFSEVKVGTDDIDAKECKVTESEQFGIVDGEKYLYAIYCLMPAFEKESKCGDNSFAGRYHSRRGLAVFVQKGEFAELLFERADPDIGIIYYEKPEIIQIGKTTMMVLKIVIDGTGSGNASEYFSWQDHKWVPIESESWQQELRTKIPAGLQIWRGIWPDFGTMTAETGLYKPTDANCCPTGGRAKIDLALENNQFVFKNVVIE